MSTASDNPPIYRGGLTDLYTRLGNIEASIGGLSTSMAGLQGELKGKLHEPASCPLREDVGMLQRARANSVGFLAGIIFLAGFLASGLTLAVSLFFQWLWK